MGKVGEYMEVNKKEVGQRIRSIRKTNGMTMEDFGRSFKPAATRSNVSKWENGSSLPSNERLPIIAELGHITVDELHHGIPIWERFDEEYNKDGKLADDVKRYEVFSKFFNEDVGKYLTFMIEQLDSGNPNLLFEGEELDEENQKLLRDSLQTNYNIIKKLNS